jgi:hypothetical protein
VATAKASRDSRDSKVIKATRTVATVMNPAATVRIQAVNFPPSVRSR